MASLLAHPWSRKPNFSQNNKPQPFINIQQSRSIGIMNKLAILFLILLAIVFASGCTSNADTSDPVIGTWISNSNAADVFVLNADGTGTDTYESQNTTKVYNVTWVYDGDYYLLDYPDTCTLSADGKTLTMDYGTVFSGNGLVGTWTTEETEIISPGFTGREYYYVFDNHTGIYYQKCIEDPNYSMMNGFLWKQQNDGSYVFYNYNTGYIFELSEDDTVQTFFGDGLQYTGNGLVGAWNRTEPLVLSDGTIMHAERVMNADGSAKLSWYYQNGTFSHSYDQYWEQIDDYYVVVAPQSLRGELDLNDDGSMTFYYLEAPGIVYHKQ